MKTQKDTLNRSLIFLKKTNRFFSFGFRWINTVTSMPTERV